MTGLLLSLSDIALTFGGEPLFRRADLDIAPGARIALVGRNGSGKSTLLKIAAGGVEPDRGARFAHPGASVRYLPQEPDFRDLETAQDVLTDGLMHPDHRRAAMMIAHELEIKPDAPLRGCSGGEMRRIAVAAALAADPDVLLLDEPTNHLDLPAIAWLEEKLSSLRAAIVVVSHDRRFLETLTMATVWIDQGETRRLNRGFEHFEAWRDQVLEEEAAALRKLGRKIGEEEDWLRYGVTARRRRNMRRLGELRAMRAKLRETERPAGAVRFSKSDAPSAGRRAIVAKNISKSFDGEMVVEDFSIEIARGEKIGVVGPNGAGKTTLLKMLIGEAPPDSGSVALGAGLAIVSLDQRRASLKPDTRLADAIADGRGDWLTIGGARRHVASYLKDFLFKPEQWRTPVSALSGGERGRLALAAALAKPSNLLALDEPTNDLDLETLDLLEELLASYEGALLLVSHDRSFIDRVATSVLATDPVNPRRWIRYAGGYDDMAAQRGAAPGARSAPAGPTPKAQVKATAPPAQRPRLSFKDEYALKELPKRIEALGAEIANLKETLADPSFYERDPGAFERAAAALAAAEAALAAAEERWLALELRREETASQN